MKGISKDRGVDMPDPCWPRVDPALTPCWPRVSFGVSRSAFFHKKNVFLRFPSVFPDRGAQLLPLFDLCFTYVSFGVFGSAYMFVSYPCHIRVCWPRVLAEFRNFRCAPIIWVCYWFFGAVQWWLDMNMTSYGDWHWYDWFPCCAMVLHTRSRL